MKNMTNLGSQICVIKSYFWVLLFLVILQQKCVHLANAAVAGVNEANAGVQDGISQFCSIDLASFLPPPYGNLSYKSCHPVWETFVLRVSLRFLPQVQVFLKVSLQFCYSIEL